MFNPWKDFVDLVSGPPLQSGVVTVVVDGVATVQLPGGGEIQARGQASVGQSVFVRGDLIEAEAPDLPLVTFTI